MLETAITLGGALTLLVVVVIIALLIGLVFRMVGR